MKRPAYNHTRADGPYDPCPECKALMTSAELAELERSQKADFEDSQRRAHEADVSAGIVPTRERLFEVLRAYAGHKFSCDYLAPMWHQGPCDCGWVEIEKELGLGKSG